MGSAGARASVALGSFFVMAVFLFLSRSRMAGGSEKAEAPLCAHSNVDDIEFRHALLIADIKVILFSLS